MKKYTRKDILDFNPCDEYNEDKLKTYFGSKKYLTPKEILSKKIPINDKLWIGVRLLSQENQIRYAVDCAERVLELFESKYPNDHRPRQAIEAAIHLLEDNTEENARAAARAAAYAADADADAYAADAAARAAAYAAYAAADAYAADAYAADAAARAAARAAYAAADAAAYAADADAYAADTAANADAEKKLQLSRIRYYLKLQKDYI